MDQLQHATIWDSLPHAGQQPLMIHAVEEFRQVDIDGDRVSVVEVCRCLGNRGVGSPVSAEPMAAVVKVWFEDRFKLKQNRLLNRLQKRKSWKRS